MFRTLFQEMKDIIDMITPASKLRQVAKGAFLSCFQQNRAETAIQESRSSEIPRAEARKQRYHLCLHMELFKTAEDHEVHLLLPYHRQILQKG